MGPATSLQAVKDPYPCDPNKSFWEPKEAPRAHGFATGLSTIEQLREARNESVRQQLARNQSEQVACLQNQLDALASRHRIENTLLDYRLDGGTLDGLGELANDSEVSEAWSTVSAEIDL